MENISPPSKTPLKSVYPSMTSNTIGKKWIILVSVLCIIVVIEIAFMTLFRDLTGNQSAPTEEMRLIPERQPVTTFVTTNEQKNVGIEKVRWFNEYFDSIKNKSELMNNTLINIVSSGYVYEAGVEEFSEGNIRYYYKIILRSNINNLHTFRFRKEEIDNARITIITRDGQKDGDFSDLTGEDSIVIDMAMDLRDDTTANRVQIRIFK